MQTIGCVLVSGMANIHGHGIDLNHLIRTELIISKGRCVNRQTATSSIVAQNGVTKTVDTISHVTRVAHKFPKAHYFLFRDNDLSVEHPYLSRSLAACRFINWLDYFTSIPTRLPHLVRFIAAFNKLSIVSLAVPVILDQETSITNISNMLKSSPEVLILWLEPGNHLLLDWLIESKTFVKSLRQLVVTLDNRVPSQEISLHAERLQSLLDLCSKHIKVWDFYRYEDLKPMPLGTVLPVVINNFTLTYLLLYSLPPDANVSRKTKIQSIDLHVQICAASAENSDLEEDHQSSVSG